MKKNLLLLLLAVVCLLSLASCGKDAEPPVSDEAQTAVPSPEPEITEDTSEPEAEETAPPTEDGEEIVFGYVMEYDGVIYETGRYGVSDWTLLPVEAGCFCIYDGYIYYVAGDTQEESSEEAPLYRADLDGGNATQLADNVSLSVLPRILDGCVVYVDNGSMGEDEESAGIYSLDPETSEATQILQGLYYNILGSYGEYIYYRYYEEGIMGLYRIRPDGGGQETIDVELGGSFILDNGYLYVSVGDSEYSVMRIDPSDPESSHTYDFTYDGMGFTVSGGWMYHSAGETVSRTETDSGLTETITSLDGDSYWAYNFFVMGEHLYFYELTDTDESGMNTVFCRAPLTGGEKEELSVVYID